MELAKITRVLPLREQVIEGVMEALRAGRFAAGQRLTEKGVAEVLGVSRTPVREALGILAQRGVISRRSGGGFVVATPELKTIAGVFELRRVLEPYAVRRAAQAATSAQLKDLRSGVLRLSSLVETASSAEFMQANTELRRMLFSIPGNEALASAIARLNDHVLFIGRLTLGDPDVRRLVVRKHRRILAALTAGDPAAAQRAMRDYLDAAYRSLLSALSAADLAAAD